MDAEVYGIDVSKDALRLSSERCAREKVRVRLFEFDGEKVPFKESMFDSIILSDVVEHVEDETLDLLLGECARLLKSDGRLIIHTSPTRNIIHLTKIIKSASFGRYDLHARLVNPDYEHLHVRYHSLGSLRRLLKKNSLYPIMWERFSTSQTPSWRSSSVILGWARYSRIRYGPLPSRIGVSCPKSWR